MPVKPWQVLSRDLLLEHAPWISVWMTRVKLANGVVIDDYFEIEMPSWVAIFAVTPEGRVPLVRQYRHGLRAHLLELPAGYIEAGETPDSAARRELREEVGCAAGRFTLLDRYAMLPERSTMMMHIVLAQDAHLIGAQELEATEDISVEWLTLPEVRAAWQSGAIPTASHAAAVARGLDAVGAL